MKSLTEYLTESIDKTRRGMEKTNYMFEPTDIDWLRNNIDGFKDFEKHITELTIVAIHNKDLQIKFRSVEYPENENYLIFRGNEVLSKGLRGEIDPASVEFDSKKVWAGMMPSQEMQNEFQEVLFQVARQGYIWMCERNGRK